MEILNLKELGDTESFIMNTLTCYLVIGKLVHLASDASSLYHILKQLHNYSWRFKIT